MARQRILSPGFFRNADLLELPLATRMLFAGLWVLADREGRVEDRPRQIKVDLFPADDVDVDQALAHLADRLFISRYVVDGVGVIQVLKFHVHQKPHPREAPSKLPAPPKHDLGEPEANLGEPQVDLDPSKDTPRRPVSVSVSVSVPVRDQGAVRLSLPDALSAPATPGPTQVAAEPLWAGATPRAHRSHAACSPNQAWCVPDAVHGKLAAQLAPRYAGDLPAAREALVAWYASVWGDLPPDTVIPDAFRFWVPRFDAAFANAPPVTPPSTLATDAAGVERYLRAQGVIQ